MHNSEGGRNAETITISRELLEGVLYALNEVRNTRLQVGRWTSTYQLASAISLALRATRDERQADRE